MGILFSKRFKFTTTESEDGFLCVHRAQTDGSQIRDLELSQEETTRPLRSNHESIQEADGYIHSQGDDINTDDSHIGNLQILETTGTVQSSDNKIPELDDSPMHSPPPVDAVDVGVTNFSYDDPIQELTANEVVILLEDCNFQFSNNWEKLTARLKIPKDERTKQKQQTRIDSNYTGALEELVDFWIRNSDHPTWQKLISAVEFYEQTTAKSMRKKLGIISEECQVRLQRRCEDNMLRELSFIIPDFTAVAPFFITTADIEDIEKTFFCNGEKIHEMLWKWRERKGRYATYLSLVHIFRKIKMDNVAHFVQENIEEPANILFEEMCFPLKKNETELHQLEDYNMKIRKRFASIVLQIRKSLLKRNIDPTDLKLYLLGIVGRCEKIDRAKNLGDIFLALYKHQSWFNFGLYEAMIEEFGGEEEKEELENYKNELSAYLKQSLIEIPNPIQQHDSGNQTRFVLKVPDYKEGLPNLSGCDVQEIKRNLARRLRIHSHSLSFCEYRLGCIELVFTMQTPLFDYNKSKTLYIIWDQTKEEYKFSTDPDSIVPSSLCERDEKLLQQNSDGCQPLTTSIGSKTDPKETDASLSYSLSVVEQ